MLQREHFMGRCPYIFLKSKKSHPRVENKPNRTDKLNEDNSPRPAPEVAAALALPFGPGAAHFMALSWQTLTLGKAISPATLSLACTVDWRKLDSITDWPPYVMLLGLSTTDILNKIIHCCGYLGSTHLLPNVPQVVTIKKCLQTLLKVPLEAK